MTKQKWFLLERVKGFDLFQSYPIIDAFAKNKLVQKNLGVKLDNFAVLLDDFSDLIAVQKDWDRASEYLMKEIVKDPKILKKVNTRILIEAKKLDCLSNRIFSIQNITYRSAMKMYEKFCLQLNVMYSWACFYEYLELGPTKLLTSWLEAKIALVNGGEKSKNDKLFRILTTSPESSWYEREHIDFLKLLKSNNKKDLDRSIARHLRKYFWIPSPGSFATWDQEYFKKKASSFNSPVKAQLKSIGSSKHRIINDIKRAETKLKMSKDDKRVFSSIRELLFLKDFRRGVQNKGFLAVYSMLFPVIADKLKVSKDDLRWMMLSEMAKGGASKKEILRRKKNCAYLVENGNGRLYIGQNKSIRRHITSLKHKSNKTIEGRVVYVGNKKIIKGKIKVVLERGDIKKIKSGDILVTHITNPDIVAILKDAAAIITDVGGLTCHATIVARELKKPCIIGTKIATQVLKDGDLVEVDAEKGVVRILKRAKK